MTQLPTHLFSDPHLWCGSQYVLSCFDFASWRDVGDATEYAVEAAVDDVVEGVYRATVQ